MDSLVISLLMLIGALFLCGPVAIWADHLGRPLLAALFATAAIWLGIFWFAHVSTAAKYLGLLSAGMGLYVVWRNARRL